MSTRVGHASGKMTVGVYGCRCKADQESTVSRQGDEARGTEVSGGGDKQAPVTPTDRAVKECKLLIILNLTAPGHTVPERVHFDS